MQLTDAIEIREFVENDHEGVRRVANEAHAFLRKFYIWKPGRNRAETDRPYVRLVATIGSIVVGTLTYETHKDHIYFGSLGVLSDYRHHGVARSFVTYLESVAFSIGIFLIQCDTIEETGNVAIFEKLGFQEFSRVISKDRSSPDGELVYIISLQKWLSFTKSRSTAG